MDEFEYSEVNKDEERKPHGPGRQEQEVQRDREEEEQA